MVGFDMYDLEFVKKYEIIILNIFSYLFEIIVEYLVFIVL